MTDEELASIAREAIAATGAHWEFQGDSGRSDVGWVDVAGRVGVIAVGEDGAWVGAAARHAAAFCPAVALNLLDRVKKLMDRARSAEATADCGALLERVRKAEDQLARIAATLEHEGPTDGVADAVKRYHEAAVDICAKAINERKAAEEWAGRLRIVGTGLANAAYNLKQQTYIPEEHRRSLDEGQRAWDAVLAGGTTPTTIAARRPSPSTDPVEVARREALVSALRLAEDVEREETSLGNAITASAAEEVKDRIKERIRWLDEGTE